MTPFPCRTVARARPPTSNSRAIHYSPLRSEPFQLVEAIGRDGVGGGAPSRTRRCVRRCRSAECEKKQYYSAVRPRRKSGRGRVHLAGWRRGVCRVRAEGNGGESVRRQPVPSELREGISK